MTNGINWKRSLAGVLPLTLAACLSGNTQPQNTAIASGLSSPTLPSSKDIAYDDQDLVSLFTHASLRRHEGDYRGSNQALERAYQRSEELYTQRLSEFGSASLRKPGALPYRPNSLEVGFISYLKALNHFATDADRLPLQQREAAAVEMRRLDVLQGEARFLQDMGLDSDKNRDLAQMVVSLFAERTNTELSQGIVDVQSPWLYVVSGIVFEINQDLDSARISYQRALDALPESDVVWSGSNDGWVHCWGLRRGASGLRHVARLPVDGWINGIHLSAKASFVAVAAAREHRLGRWWNDKSVRPALHVVPLLNIVAEVDDQSM